MNDDLKTKISKARMLNLIAGLAGALLSVIGFLSARQDFAYSYLVNFLFVLSFAVGALPLIMLHHLAGGGWGYAVRRILEIFAGFLPLAAIAFIPLYFSLGDLYLWARPEAVAHDHILQQKEYYLNVPFFTARAAVYFLLWAVFAFLLARGSLSHNKTLNEKTANRLKSLSAGGLIIYGITVTFSSIDWGMTLEPHWFSTIYGLFFVIGNGLAAFAAAIFLAGWLTGKGALSKIMTPSRSHDLGKLFFAFIMLWAYMHLSQFIIVWSGNIAEETPWYIKRFRNGWQVLSLALAFLQFALPFFLLLSRDLKRNIKTVCAVAVLVIVMRWVDIFWMIKPAHYAGLQFHWLDLTTLLALMGLFKFFVLSRLLKEPAYFSYDPNLTENHSEAHHA